MGQGGGREGVDEVGGRNNSVRRWEGVQECGVILWVGMGRFQEDG